MRPATAGRGHLPAHLHASQAAPDSGLSCLVSQASQVLDSTVLCKDAVAVGHVGTICAVLSTRYGRLEGVAGMLLDAINSHEHTPVAVAQALQVGAESYEDGQLVREGAGRGPAERLVCCARLDAGEWVDVCACGAADLKALARRERTKVRAWEGSRADAWGPEGRRLGRLTGSPHRPSGGGGGGGPGLRLAGAVRAAAGRHRREGRRAFRGRLSRGAGSSHAQVRPGGLGDGGCCAEAWGRSECAC